MARLAAFPGPGNPIMHKQPASGAHTDLRGAGHAEVTRGQRTARKPDMRVGRARNPTTPLLSKAAYVASGLRGPFAARIGRDLVVPCAAAPALPTGRRTQFPEPMSQRQPRWWRSPLCHMTWSSQHDDGQSTRGRYPYTDANPDLLRTGAYLAPAASDGQALRSD